MIFQDLTDSLLMGDPQAPFLGEGNIRVTACQFLRGTMKEGKHV